MASTGWICISLLDALGLLAVAGWSRMQKGFCTKYLLLIALVATRLPGLPVVCMEHVKKWVFVKKSLFSIQPMGGHSSLLTNKAIAWSTVHLQQSPATSQWIHIFTWQPEIARGSVTGLWSCTTGDLATETFPANSNIHLQLAGECFD